MLGLFLLSVRTFVIAEARGFMVSQYSEQGITCVVKRRGSRTVVWGPGQGKGAVLEKLLSRMVTYGTVQVVPLI